MTLAGVLEKKTVVRDDTGGGHPPRSKRIWWTVLRRPVNMIALLVIFVVVIMAIGGGGIAPQDPYRQNIVMLLQPPGLQHPFGTDELGRDILSRIIAGARDTVYAGIAAVGIGTILGSLLGLVSGYFAGWVDDAIMTFTDVLLSFPYFLLVVLIVAVLGPSLTSATIAVGIWTAPYFTRVVRANAAELRGRPFVEAAIVSGETPANIIFRYVLPNCLSSIVVLSTTYLSQAILMAAALSFLGLGAQPPQPEWGAMTAIGREHLFDAPHVIMVPAACIFLTALALNFLGDAVRDVLDPRESSI
jgi:ABC-type dipeptide/oligopeptide/nickel transport system permease subunit